MPSFEGEPKLIGIPNDMDEFTETLWHSLNEDNKYLFRALYRYRDRKYETKIVNKIINKDYEIRITNKDHE